MSIRNQCRLLSVNRSNLYYEPVEINDTEIANIIMDIWLEAPTYGYRKITRELNDRGFVINHKRVLRIMREMNIQALYPKPNLSKRNIQHKKYPYLLKGMNIIRPNQVWATDITYIKIPGGYIYLIAIIDWYSRFIISWQVSTSMDILFCTDVLKDAFNINKPDILNTDQGSQFTSETWINLVEGASVQVSMDGKGRWADNIIIERFWRTLKHEGIFLEIPNTIYEAKKIIGKFIDWYNFKRLHQSLKYKTPAAVYKNMPPAG